MMKSFLLHPLVLVFAGGGAGSLIRYSVARLLSSFTASRLFPVSTLIVNVVASFLLGGVIGWALSRSTNEEVRLLIGVGFCGGLSTFSSFSQETLTLVEHNRWESALLNVTLNVILCLVSSWSGLMAGQRI